MTTFRTEVDTLLTEAEALEQEAEAIQETARQKLAEAQEKYASIRDLADQQSGDFQIDTTSSPAAAPSAPKKNAIGKIGSGKVAKKKTTNKKTTNKKPAAKVSPGQRNYDSEKRLKQAIFDVLDEKKLWKSALGDDLADGTKGLTAGEIKLVIDHTKWWASSGSNPMNQISGAINSLREKGYIERGDNRRYNNIKGVKLPENMKK